MHQWNSSIEYPWRSSNGPLCQSTLEKLHMNFDTWKHYLRNWIRW